MGEEGSVESKSYKVGREEEDKGDKDKDKEEDNEEEESLRHRGILKLDQLRDSTAYWAALTTITQVLSLFPIHSSSNCFVIRKNICVKNIIIIGGSHRAC